MINDCSSIEPNVVDAGRASLRVRGFTIPLPQLAGATNYGEVVKLTPEGDSPALCVEQMPCVRASGSNIWSLQDHVEVIKLVDAPIYVSDRYRDFPRKGLHKFRDRLAAKLEARSLDPDLFVKRDLEAVSANLEEYLFSIVESLADAPAVERGEESVPSPESVLAAGLGLGKEMEGSFLSEPAGECAQVSLGTNPFSVLRNFGDECTLSSRLLGKARALVRFFKSHGLRQTHGLPSSLVCGQLRTSVRRCFDEGLGPLWELSFKTVQKVEKSACKACLPRFQARLDSWRESRFHPESVDPAHLERFATVMRRNIDEGWDRYRAPFIPNGHATVLHGRSSGGNWNREEMSDECDACLVFSSGKPRVVTKYSSANTQVLAPLHYSLYTVLKKKGWLLVGEPTESQISKLNGADFVSIDYEAATDNIQASYVKKSVEVLIERARGLSDEELMALRHFSELRLVGTDGIATRGQPMGSVLSFPLLCLINKTIIDLAIDDLLMAGSIKYSEWVNHRCLVNGDDGLFREPRSGTNMRDRVAQHARLVGPRVNKDKTMCDPVLAEINSTLFSSRHPLEGGGVLKHRKVNASLLWMDADVGDVLKLSWESTQDIKGFLRIARANSHILAKQMDKGVARLPPAYRAAVRRDKKLRMACTCLPERVRPVPTGPLTMAEAPADYYLDRESEHAAMVAEIERVRESAVAFFSERRPRFRSGVVKQAQSFNVARKHVLCKERNLIPSCYVRCFDLKKREDVLRRDLDDPVADDGLEVPPSDQSQINRLVDYIRANRSPPRTCEEGGLRAMFEACETDISVKGGDS